MEKNTIVGFGEIMGRIEPKGFNRIRQSMPGELNLTFAGAECNVVVSLQMMGRSTRFVTALPKNILGDACLDSFRRFGVDSRYVLRREGRLGLYFLETGANQRPSNVIYDREGSVVSKTSGMDYDWVDIFKDAAWFHISGITPAISREAAEASLIAVKKAREYGVTVSCDLNFRKKLWGWDTQLSSRDLAEKTMRGVLPFVDVVIANEEDAWDVLRIQAAGSDAAKGKLIVERYPDVASAIVKQFPNIHYVAITLRESYSATYNKWGGMLYDADGSKAIYAPVSEDGTYLPYEIRNIVDRVGGGDAFAAGIIYGLTDPELSKDHKLVISYATAASCLCHSINGDFNYSTREEINTLMKGDKSGRVQR